MTAHDVILGHLWAVIDRPYKGTAGTNLSLAGFSCFLPAFWVSFSTRRRHPR